MIRNGISLSAFRALILGFVLLTLPLVATAQRHGGAGIGGGGLSGTGRPTGVKEDDSLKDFHQAMALQATAQQASEFHALVKNTMAAKTVLQEFLQPLPPESGVAQSARREALDQALESVWSGNKKFQQEFSAAQKSGLKDVVKRLAKADSELEQEAKKLDQSMGLKSAPAQVAAHAESLSKALTDFYNEQLALGREMSITLALGQDLTFTLPAVNHPIDIANRTIGIPVSGILQQMAKQGGERTFEMELIADLSELQQNITELLRAQLDSSESCGQRVAIRRATLRPSTPASVLVLQMHFERWTCPQSYGQQTSNELAEGDGTVELKLTAAVEKPNTLKILATFGRVDAPGMMGEALRSGSLGEDLRGTVAKCVLTAAQSALDFKVLLPPAVQNSAVLQVARFQDAGVSVLTVVLDGQLQISSEQADQLASQLNQAPSAQGTPAR
jgi:hypothetical protein